MADRTTVQCPACWHRETMRARKLGVDPCHDDAEQMVWLPPAAGARGQVVSLDDLGVWRCEWCGLMAPPTSAGILLDAALMHSDPECDSIVDGMHKDARDACVALVSIKNGAVKVF